MMMFCLNVKLFIGNALNRMDEWMKITGGVKKHEKDK